MNRILENEAIATTNSAQRFNQVMGRGAIQREYERLATEVVTMGVPLSGRGRDVGTGPGYVARAVARQLAGRAQITGLDLSPAMLALAGENAVRNGVSAWVEWKQGDGKAMPFADAQFDFVVSSGSLHHWNDPLPVLTEIVRVLKPTGQCLIHDSKRLLTWQPRLVAWAIGLTIPADFRKHYWGSIHASYTANELRSLLQAPQFFGWQIKEDLLSVCIVKQNGGGIQ
jgi:ubiquinone/menaquinone biosynthesis C-methylase UbiE